MAPLVRTGGSRHTGLAAPPHRNIQYQTSISDIQKSFIQIKCSKQEESKKVQIPAHPTTHSAKNWSAFPDVTEHISASADQ